MIVALIRARHAVAAAAVALLVVLLLYGEEVRFDQSLESFFAADDPVVLAYKEASGLFGHDQFVFVAYDDPALVTPEGMERVGSLADSIRGAGIEGVVAVQSLDEMPALWRLDEILLGMEKLPGFLRSRAVDAIEQVLASGEVGARGVPTIAGAVAAAADDPEELERLRERIIGHPLLKGTLVSADGATTALMVRLREAGQHDAKATVGRLRELADRFGESQRLGRRPAVVGPPVLLADGFEAIEVDGDRLATAGMLLIGLVTLTATRSLWWAAVPLLAGWTVWLATETILGLVDLRLSLSSGPLVAQIIVLTMPAASHLALHFRDDLRRSGDRRRAAEETLRAVSTPILWCAGTAAIGYGALVTSNVVPIRQFGAVLAIASAGSSLLTIVLAPSAMVPIVPLEIPVRPGSTSRISRAMDRITARVVRHPGPIVLGTLVAVAPIVVGIVFIRYESNYINAFKPTTRVVRDYRFVEDRLGGIGLVGIVLPIGEEVDAGMLGRLRRLDEDIVTIRRHDGERAIASSTSLATVLDPDGLLVDLDEEGRAWLIDTKLRLIGATPQGDLLRNFWNRDAGRARVLVRLSESQPAPEKMAAFERTEDLARRSFTAEEFGDRAYLTGLSHLLTQTTRGVIETQWTTFTTATVGILIMLTLAFRGPKLAVLALLPTMLSVGLVLGLMGWIGLKLDIATALVASVALGLSVDDTFHCLLQFRRLRERMGFEEALFASYAVTGPGVILSSFAVTAGFSVLLASVFVPFATFGLMVAIATAGSSLGNVVLLPACLSLAHRRAERRRSRAVAGAATDRSPSM